MTVKEREVPFKKWTFVDKNDLDNEHWYVRLEGGKFHDVIYRYMEIKLNETTKSINFDYEIVDYPFDDPHGETEFNEAAGDILKSILDDAMEKQDYVLGKK
ncbi:MAG: hypothetical protein CMP84_12160 [Gammaproteobacteria bacterium]|nr:hypothetical protein [Gammaproteobacteria bacterium]|tara:strand:+ start:576 stop:878 length:303 start_codon:yes stop_codon:yes gene_type:complete